MASPPSFLIFTTFLLLLLLFLTTTISAAKHPIASAPAASASPSPTASPAIPSPKTPATPSTPISSRSPLDPKQVRALQSLNIPTSRDPCSPAHNSTIVCDASSPFRHLLSLTLTNCSEDVALSLTALKSLSTLTSFQFINCPITAVRFPSELTANLRTFTCINSLKKLTSVWLSKLENVTDLTVSDVPVSASGPAVILDSLKKLRSVTLANTNLTGSLPRHWHPNLTRVDLSENHLKGRIPSSINVMENLLVLNLSSNSLEGEIPSSIGDLTSLQNLSLSSNSISGSIPDSIAAIPDLVHLDLGSNKLNGTVPKFLADMKKLKFLNLENNSFHGILPFNASFLARLEMFKLGGNGNLCYNHSTLAVKVKLGIAPCDKHGMPMSPPAKDTSSDSSSNDYSTDDYSDNNKQEHHHHGPSKAVLGIAIGLSSIVFLIIFMILLARCCCK